MEGGPHWNWNTHIQLAWILPQKKNDQSTLEIEPRQRVSHCPLFFNADFPLHFQDHNLSALVVTDVCLLKANDVNVMDLCQWLYDATLCCIVRRAGPTAPALDVISCVQQHMAICYLLFLLTYLPTYLRQQLWKSLLDAWGCLQIKRSESLVLHYG